MRSALRIWFFRYTADHMRGAPRIWVSIYTASHMRSALRICAARVPSLGLRLCALLAMALLAGLLAWWLLAAPGGSTGEGWA
jgi:hypothetical protein